MRATLPVIAFTVLSGAGLGVLALVALADLGAAYLGWPALAPRQALALAAGVGLVLVVAGLISSTPHLANPRHAWRSASRFGTSWLSREAVLAIALLPVAAALVVALWLDVRPRRMWGFAAATIALAWTALFCTAMIDASLESIHQRHALRVSLAGFVLAHASGALIVEAIVRADGGATWIASAGVALLLTAWLLKEEHWRFARSAEDALTPEMAAPLADAGHSSGTFPTRELVDADAGACRTFVRGGFFVASIALPAVWLVAGLDDPLAGAAVALSCLAGQLAERWLFVADARHTVRLFHGERRT